MSPNLDSLVRTQMAVGVLKDPLSGMEEHRGSPRVNGKQPVGRRRVFVQTETGCVLGLELEREDNVHTVKRKLQVALNFPADESSLSFGDRILKDDLRSIRKDSPLLLTRKQMHRSSSTPCLSPRGRDIQQRDQSGPIEVLGQSNGTDRFDITRHLVKEVIKGLHNGVDPIPVHNGLGGAYYFRDVRGESVAIVKPTDEEPFAPNNPKGFVGKALGQPGLKRSVRVGETGVREVAAYLLDHDHFANVPATALVKITHSIFNINDGVSGNVVPNKEEEVSKIASFQQFIPHDFDASDHGTSSFPVSAIHRIGILDIRVLNTDRHAGNLLVRKKIDGSGRFGQVDLVPIDHGLCLPEGLEDPYFEWIHWPQASIPFSEDELEYIENLDPIKECETLKSELPMIRDACLRVLVLCTTFLKEAAAYGLCLAEIGEMMSREFRGGEEEPSELEVVCLEARRLVAEREGVGLPRSVSGGDEALFHIDDCEEVEWDCVAIGGSPGDDVMRRSFTPYCGVNGGRNPLSRLEESIEEEEGSDKGEKQGKGRTFAERPPFWGGIRSAPTLSASTPMKDHSFGEKSEKYCWMKPENGYGSSGGHRSANEQIPASASFVKLAEMKEEEWGMFLEKAQQLLIPAFAERDHIDDCEEVEWDCVAIGGSPGDDVMRRSFTPYCGVNGGRNPLSRLEESIEEEEGSDKGEKQGKGRTFAERPPFWGGIRSAPTLSASTPMKDHSFGEKSEKYCWMKPENGYGSSGGHRSANEQIPASASFVKLAEMKEEEWGMFLEKAQQLLIPAFAERKMGALGQRQRLRLGASCQF